MNVTLHTNLRAHGFKYGKYSEHVFYLSEVYVYALTKVLENARARYHTQHRFDNALCAARIGHWPSMDAPRIVVVSLYRGVV